MGSHTGENNKAALVATVRDSGEGATERERRGAASPPSESLASERGASATRSSPPSPLLLPLWRHESLRAF